MQKSQAVKSAEHETKNKEAERQTQQSIEIQIQVGHKFPAAYPLTCGHSFHIDPSNNPDEEITETSAETSDIAAYPLTCGHAFHIDPSYNPDEEITVTADLWRRHAIKGKGLGKGGNCQGKGTSRPQRKHTRKGPDAGTK